MFKKKEKTKIIEIDPIQQEIDRLVKYLKGLKPGTDEYETVVHEVEILMKAKALRDNDMDERTRQETIRIIKAGLAQAMAIISGGVIKYILVEVIKGMLKK